MQSKKIRFKLKEEDILSNDELINQEFVLPKNSDYLYIDIDLKKVPESKGDDSLEGWEQELFVDIEVLETHSHTKTGTLNVNNSSFGTDPVDNTNKVVKVGWWRRKKGIILRAIDDVKCPCGKCDGFGLGQFNSVYVSDKPKVEACNKYEYPRIHRSLFSTFKAVMFYTSVKEKSLGYTVKCIFSAYRCWNINNFHDCSSTNHMGKALDIHFYKNGKRKDVLITDREELRENIYIKHLGTQLNLL